MKSIQNAMKTAKDFVVRKTELCNKDFQTIDKKLKEFNQIKSTENAEIIIKYTNDVLKLFPFWKQDYLKNQLDLLLPIKQK